ncbi:ATP-binding cassette domain-containing protein [Ferrimonas balearica]|nr:ATP-binding cassette domain-containing protein [Ferrimonas balearica]
MRALWRVLKLLLGASPKAMARGAALAVTVLLMGVALLGLSGWFITATGLAGLAGIGIAFNVFQPSAGVRLLALGRTAARYGERLLTHDATLRALAALRVDLLRRQARAGGRALARLRSEATLTRILADVDALDGLVLRLALPVFAALLTHAVVFAMLGWLAGWPLALTVAAIYLPLAALVLWRLARAGMAPSREGEREAQALRRGMIDMIRDREALILGGQLAARETALRAGDARARAASGALDRAERRAGARLSALVALSVAGALVAGGWLAQAGGLDPARAAIGIFVALALAETVLPLRRGFAELGRMVDAASRVDPGASALGDGSDGQETDRAEAPILSVDRPEARFTLQRGEALALEGPSGVGKTTLLLRIAGLMAGEGITIAGHAPEDWTEDALRARVAMLPQRSALIAGTIRDNLALAAPEATDETFWQALEVVALDIVVRDRGGLDARLGESGAGLSGGQSRRLALARCVLRAPDLLLLDEPTEGLDPATATRVLDNLRAALPDSAILATLHRGGDHVIFTERLTISRP